ncbi:MAG TPA: hypothetical protein VN837_14235 [Chloroflexota bacterium]|nr:hypothetical protein [Chloroflexota bacterium]
MSRYFYTFSRFWWLLIIPVLVLPAAEYIQVRHAGAGFVASMNIYVQATAASSATTSGNTWSTLAQIEAADINQWLQSPTFCLNVAEGSANYSKLLKVSPDPKQAATTDLQKNVSVTATGDNLVSIAYSSQDPALAVQVVQSVLTNATISMQRSNGRVASVNKAYYQSQLYNAEATERTSAQQLAAYMRQHGVTSTNLDAQMVSDPTLALLYNQDKANQQTVSTLRQNVQAVVAQSSLPATLVNQDGYYIADPASATYVSQSKKKELMPMGIALVLGLLLAGAFLVVMTAVDRTFRRPADVPFLLELPVLAVVPLSLALAGKAPHPNIRPMDKPKTRRRVGAP